MCDYFCTKHQFQAPLHNGSRIVERHYLQLWRYFVLMGNFIVDWYIYLL